MEIENSSKEDLFKAIWDNFEHFDIIGYPNKEGDQTTTFITQNIVRRFVINNFIGAYNEG